MSEQKEQGLVARLRTTGDIDRSDGRLWQLPIVREAADALEAQAAEIAKLRAVIESLQMAIQEPLARAQAAETALATAREDVMEEAAKDCDRVEKRFNDKARISNGDVYALGVAGGAGICAENIRALKTKEPSHG